MSDSLQPHGVRHTRLPCPSPAICLNSCPSSQWCHPAISSSVGPFSSCPQSFPASGSFPMSWLFASSGQSIGASVSASVFIAPKWKQPKCPSTKIWVNKTWYKHTMEYYSAMKRYEVLTCTTMRINLENMLSEGSSKRPHFVWFHL